MFKRLMFVGLCVLGLSGVAFGQPRHPDQDRGRQEVRRAEPNYGQRYPDRPRYGVERPLWRPRPVRPTPPLVVPYYSRPLYPFGAPSVYAYIEYLEWLRRQEAIRRLQQEELYRLYR